LLDSDSIQLKSLIIFLLILSGNTCDSQAVFSPLSCQDLENRTITFPTTEGSNTVVVITFSDNAEEQLKTWIDPLYQKFVAKSGMLDGLFNADIKLLSFVSVAQLAVIKMNASAIKKDLPAPLVNSVLYTTSSPDNVKVQISFKNEKTVYVLVLSPEGKILKQVSGAFTEDKMESIEDVL